MICNNSFYSGSRHTCRPFLFYVLRLTAHGLSTDDTHGSRAVDIMCNGSGSVQQYNAMTTDTRKPSEFVQTHGRWRNGSEFRKRARRSCATDPEAVTVDDHATDTMTGTAHMLSDCVPSMTTPRRPWNVQRRMFFVLRLTYWSACAVCPERVTS